jgi:hypothetical protein
MDNTSRNFSVAGNCRVSAYTSMMTTCTCVTLSSISTRNLQVVENDSVTLQGVTFSTVLQVNAITVDQIFTEAVIPYQKAYSVIVTLIILGALSAVMIFLPFLRLKYVLYRDQAKLSKAKKLAALIARSGAARKSAKVAVDVKVDDGECNSRSKENDGSGASLVSYRSAAHASSRNINEFISQAINVPGLHTNIGLHLVEDNVWINLVKRMADVDVPFHMSTFLGAGRLISILFGTVFIMTVLFPDNQRCEHIESSSACAAATNTLGTPRVCRWDQKGEFCAYNEHAVDAMVMAVLLLIATIVSTTAYRLFEFLLRESFIPLISSEHDETPDDYAKKDFKINPSADEFRLHSTKLSLLLLAARLRQQTLLMDSRTSLEESLLLLRPGRQGDEPIREKTLVLLNARHLRSENLRFGNYLRGRRLESLNGKIVIARKFAQSVKTDCSRIDDVPQKELYLLRSFLGGCFQLFQNSVARRVLKISRPADPSTVATVARHFHRTVFTLLLGGYTLVLAAVMFFFNFELGSRAATRWLSLFLLALCEDIFFVHLLSIVVPLIFLRFPVIREINFIARTLQTRRKLILQRTFGLISLSGSLLHHFNPACRTARQFPQLPVSRFLIALNDFDVATNELQPEDRKLLNASSHTLNVLLSPLGVLSYCIQDGVIELIVGIGTNIVLYLLILMSTKTSVGIAVIAAVVAVAVLTACVFSDEIIARARQAWLGSQPNGFLPTEQQLPTEKLNNADDDSDATSIALKSRLSRMSYGQGSTKYSLGGSSIMRPSGVIDTDIDVVDWDGSDLESRGSYGLDNSYGLDDVDDFSILSNSTAGDRYRSHERNGAASTALFIPSTDSQRHHASGWNPYVKEMSPVDGHFGRILVESLLTDTEIIGSHLMNVQGLTDEPAINASRRYGGVSDEVPRTRRPSSPDSTGSNRQRRRRHRHAAMKTLPRNSSMQLESLEEESKVYV